LVAGRQAFFSAFQGSGHAPDVCRSRRCCHDTSPTCSCGSGLRVHDDVIDVNCYALLPIAKVSKGNRKIGLGVMGLADALYLLGIPYESEQAVQLGEKFMHEISLAAREASEALAEARGAFPNFAGSIYDRHGGHKIRNATLTTIAPTGSISLIAGCSSGIEPNFALAYNRKVAGENALIINPVFERVTWERRLYRPGLLEEILRRGGLREIEEIPDDVRRVFVTAHEIAPEWHVRMQAAFQKHTDNAVSKTVNLPLSATPDDVKNIFLMAWKLGCKGITVYRDTSRPDQVLAAGGIACAQGQPRERPAKTTGMTKKVRVGCGNLYITANRDAHGLCEVFTNVGRGGGCPSQVEAIGRLVSIALRSAVAPEAIVAQLLGVRCLSTIAAKKERDDIAVLSCPDAIGRTIAEVLNGCDGDPEPVFPEICPDCDAKLERDGGRCVICRSCGFSRCF